MCYCCFFHLVLLYYHAFFYLAFLHYPGFIRLVRLHYHSFFHHVCINMTSLMLFFSPTASFRMLSYIMVSSTNSSYIIIWCHSDFIKIQQSLSPSSLLSFRPKHIMTTYLILYYQDFIYFLFFHYHHSSFFLYCSNFCRLISLRLLWTSGYFLFITSHALI